MMRIAWIGTPSVGGGVGGMCRLLLRELAQLPLELDVYAHAPLEDTPELLGLFDNETRRYRPFLYSWDWSAWYGRRRQLAFIASFVKRLPLHGRMVQALAAEHRRRPYDAVIQFSQGELLSLGDHSGEMPLVLFPCVHAAGELYWCRREAHLAQRCESWWWRWFRHWYLGYRARLQKRDYNRVRAVIGMSRRFNHWIARDYGVPAERMGVVYHPIEAGPSEPSPRHERTPIRLLFVGRISVRKGIDLLIQVIPKVLQAHPDVEVVIIGAGSLWSDYEPLLEDLPPNRCQWLKSLPNDAVVEQMCHSDVLLVPSLYEPGGIVVGEALAQGMIVVASDEVGSAENLPDRVCHEFAAGNAEQFLSAIGQAIASVRTARADLGRESTQAAEAQFAPPQVAVRLVEEISRLLKLPATVMPAESLA